MNESAPTPEGQPSACRYCARCVDAGSLGVLGDVLPLIASTGLRDLRDLLLDDGRWSGLLPAQRLLRAGLVDAVARRMVAELGRHEADAIAAGELLPVAPADLSDLDTRA